MGTSWRFFAILAVSLASLASGGSGRQQPHASGVSVTPDDGDIHFGAGQKGVMYFTVRNTGTAAATFTLTHRCAGTVADCTLTTGSLTLEAGASRLMGVTLTAGPVGTAGWVWVYAHQSNDASVQDHGVRTLSSWTVPIPGAPGEVGDQPAQERSHCLMMAAGAGAAYECGDLRLVHELPTTTILNRGFTPVLLYNSQHAHPYPIVAETFTPPTGRPTPVRVLATLRLDRGGGPPVRVFPGWAAGATRRIAVGFDGSGLPTGLHGYTLEVTAEYADGSVLTRPARSGTLLVVNRLRSPFGAGWWPAGVEKVVDLGDGSWLWLGGDGSTRRFFPVPWTGNTRWAAQSPVGADTLVWMPARARYARLLAGGDSVLFDAQGRQVEVVSRLGLRTRFDWGVGDSLQVMRLPVTASYNTGYAYTFEYGNPYGRLSRVVAPGPRTVTVHGSAARMDSIRDPDTHRVRFGYGDATARIATRTDRRGATTLFIYDEGSRLRVAQTPVPGAATITRTFHPAESRGLTVPITLADLYTTYNGPRDDVQDAADHAWFGVDRRGAVTWSRDAFGYETRLFREDPRWPGLVTRVRYANGREVAATYDERGRILSRADFGSQRGGRFATTLYEWGARADELLRVVQPEGEVTSFGYHPTTGQRVWEQVGDDPARGTSYTYHAPSHPVAPGLVEHVTSPGGTDRFDYDAIGNLRATISPTGIRTELRRDVLGRVVVSVQPINPQAGLYQRDSTVYDAMDRVRETVSTGPQMVHPRAYTVEGEAAVVPAETLFVSNSYDPEGNLLRASRRASPDLAGVGTVATAWEYDAAGRRTVEVAPDGLRDSTFYDPAGNIVRVKTRRGHQLRMGYDAVNRLTKRVVPSVSYQPWSVPVTSVSHPRQSWHFPLVSTDLEGNATLPNPDGSHGLTVPSDSATFAYDAVGNMIRAVNRDAQVRRRYHSNGLLAADTLVIRTYQGGNTTAHVYGLRYDYDLNGRRTALHHPSQLGLTPDWTVHYEYDPVTGQLGSVDDLSAYTFRYDLEGRLTNVSLPGGVGERFDYDAEGRLWHRLKAGAEPLHADTFAYDARGKVVRVGTRGAEVRNGYSGLGSLVWSSTDRYVEGVNPEEAYRVDALGNVAQLRRTHVTARQEEAVSDHLNHLYQPGTGRLNATQQRDPGGSFVLYTEASFYDPAGNRERYASTRPVDYLGLAENRASLVERTASYYGADGKLRVVDRRTCAFGYSREGVYDCHPPYADARPTFEEYRYDALGRRVVIRTDQSWSCQANCVNGVTRTVWDGDRILHEIRAHASAPEQDNGPMPQFTPFPGLYGRVAYTYGAALDHPLALYRIEHGDPHFDRVQMVVPHANWRGDFELGTFEDGSTHRCVRVPLQPGDEPTGSTRIPGDGEGDGEHEVVRYTDHCWALDFPGKHLWMSHLSRKRDPAGPAVWGGSLVLNKRDLTGQLYMRNRYYDPQAGRFTQEDPIGIAGGLNVYGFAAGDPVSYDDPYGLCPCALVVVAVGLFEVGSAAYDVYTTVRAFKQGGVGEGAEAVRATVIGAVVPGPGNAYRQLGDVLDGAGRVIPREIPATGPRVTRAQSRQIQEMGNAYGCHQCGAMEPGGNRGWVGDHVPSTALNEAGKPQVLRPHCNHCSWRQGAEVANARRTGRHPEP